MRMRTPPKMDRPLIWRPGRLAAALDVAPSTLYRWEKSGRMPPRARLADGVSGWLDDDIRIWLRSRSQQNREAEAER